MIVSAAVCVLLSIFGIGSATSPGSRADPLTCISCDGTGTNNLCTAKTLKVCPVDVAKFNYCFTLTATDAVTKKKTVTRGCYAAAAEGTSKEVCNEMDLTGDCVACKTNNCNREITEAVTRTCKQCKDANDVTCLELEDTIEIGKDDTLVPYCYSLKGTVDNKDYFKKGLILQPDSGLTDVCDRITKQADDKCNACDENLCDKEEYPKPLNCRKCKTNDKTCDETEKITCSPTFKEPNVYCYHAVGKENNVDVVTRGCKTTEKEVVSETAVCGLLNVPKDTCKICATTNCNAEPPKSTLKCYTCDGSDDKTCLEKSDAVCNPDHDEEAYCQIIDYTENDTQVVEKGCVYIDASLTEKTFCEIKEAELGPSGKMDRCKLCKDEEYCNGSVAMVAGFLFTIAAVFTAMLH